MSLSASNIVILKGQPGYANGSMASTVYGPDEYALFVRDAEALGLDGYISESNENLCQCKDSGGKITGEFENNRGGMLAWGVADYGTVYFEGTFSK